MSGIKTDNSKTLINALSEIDRLQSEVERLRGRCGELEEFAAFAQQTAERELDPDYVPPRTAEAMLALLEASRQITGEVEACDYENPWLLRKQAEAVEQYAKALRMWLESMPGNPRALFAEGVKASAEQADRHAQRLRQRAAESENE